MKTALTTVQRRALEYLRSEDSLSFWQKSRKPPMKPADLSNDYKMMTYEHIVAKGWATIRKTPNQRITSTRDRSNSAVNYDTLVTFFPCDEILGPAGGLL